MELYVDKHTKKIHILQLTFLNKSLKTKKMQNLYGLELENWKQKLSNM